MERALKVLILLPSFAGGGAERTVLNLLKATLHSVDFKVSLLEYGGEYLGEVDTNRFIDLPSERSSGSNSILRSPLRVLHLLVTELLKRQRSALDAYRPDVLLTVTESMHYLGLLWQTILPQENLKWVIRSGNNTVRELESKGKLPSFFLKQLSKRAYRRADGIIAISRGVKELLIDNFGIEPGKIQVIYNPLDLVEIERLSNEPSVLDFRYILGIGRLEHQKRFDIMIRAFGESGLAVRNCHLVILGEGSKRPDLEALIEQLGLSARVHLLGFQKNPYVFLKNASLFVLSSDWEGFAHVVAEALACGRYVLSTDCPYGPAEILDGKYGELVAVGDVRELARKMAELVDRQNQGLLPNSHHLREGALRFAATRIVRGYNSYLMSVLAKC